MRIKEGRRNDKRDEVTMDKPRETERMINERRTTYIEQSRIGFGTERKNFHITEEISRYRNPVFTIRNFTLYI